MVKIHSIKFIKHPILGDLKLDFRDPDGNAVDTVIIAGENGTGKSAVINALYDAISSKPPADCVIEIDINGRNLSCLKKVISA